MAFSRGKMKFIFRRDKHKCVDCGRGKRDGVILQAAHKDHVQSKTHPLYKKADGGETKCLECHAAQHDRLAAIALSQGDKKMCAHHKRAATLVRNYTKAKSGWKSWFRGLWHDTNVNPAQMSFDNLTGIK